jgi:hypothetical protein
MISDLSKYKRFFAFGCSFTSYCPPTWADILASEMPNCEYHNFGRGGAGNLFISNRIAQANSKFKFNEDDLVVVMFSTMCREDRFIDEVWRTHGSIYNQGYYDKKFVKKYCDPIGYIVRDLALIEMTTQYLNSLPCNTVFLSLTDLSYEAMFIYETDDPTIARLKDIYPKMNIPCMVEIGSEGFYGLELIDEDGTLRRDGHPSTLDHLNFLLKYNFPITDVGKEYTNEILRRLETIKTWDELYDSFPELTHAWANNDLAII